MKQKILRLLPGFAAPLAALLVNVFVYYFPRLVRTVEESVSLETALDRALPFVPFFIVFYVGAYLQWAAYYIRTGLDTAKGRTRFAAGEMLAKGICLVLFLAVPVTIVRPEVKGDGLFPSLVRFLYSIDTPQCLFPSIHCLQSWLCVRYTAWKRGWASPAALAEAAFSALVFASTVLLRQHFALDVLAGVLAAEAGLIFADRSGLTARLDRMTEKIRRLCDAAARKEDGACS